MMCIIVGYILYWGISYIGTYVILGGRHLLGGGRRGGRAGGDVDFTDNPPCIGNSQTGLPRLCNIAELNRGPS